MRMNNRHCALLQYMVLRMIHPTKNIHILSFLHRTSPSTVNSLEHNNQLFDVIMHIMSGLPALYSRFKSLHILHYSKDAATFISVLIYFCGLYI